MPELSGLGDRTAGIWTRRQALALVSPDQIGGWLRDGSWQSPLPGVYADGGYALDAIQWGHACVLASGGTGQPATQPAGSGMRSLRAVACGRPAARVWGIPLIDDDDPATGAQDRHRHDVAVWRYLPELRSPGRPPAVLRRHQLALAPGEVVRHPSGLWLTSPARTLRDLTGLVSQPALVCALDHALNRQLLTAEALRDGARAGRWRPRFLAALALCDKGAESPAETLTRLLLKPDLPGLRTQVRLFDGDGRVIARLDLGEERLKLAVEADGKRGHAGDTMAAKDRRRDAAAAAQGWQTLRVTWFELRRQSDAFRRRVLASAARRA